MYLFVYSYIVTFDVKEINYNIFLSFSLVTHDFDVNVNHNIDILNFNPGHMATLRSI